MQCFIVPNEDTFPDGWLDSMRAQGWMGAVMRPESLEGDGHGTLMAVIAAGREHGVAPNADLYLVRTKGRYNRDSTDETDPGAQDRSWPLQAIAVNSALDHVRNDIESRLSANPSAKSVVNMSWGENPVLRSYWLSPRRL